jgi:2-C-methyl-D-erythritol 4-phosphate cytidylyltransferase / 2-C-methyl-D-erythritol 2,4-cyclodiphosphate synthase
LSDLGEPGDAVAARHGQAPAEASVDEAPAIDGSPAVSPGAVDPARPLPAVDVVVVAAGRSTRMDGIDKLEASLAGRPLLARATWAMAASPLVRRIVIVTAPERVERVRAAAWLPPAVVAVVAGEGRRQGSVAAGLAALDRLDAAPAGSWPAPGAAGDDVVLIHDGARPLAPPALVERVAVAAARHGAAIPVLPVAETLKRVEGDRIVATVDRAGLAASQTPQGFRRGLLRAAYERMPPSGATEWTDEGALLEACRIPVHVVPGDPINLKVTLPDDLVRAEALIATPARARIGIGHDSHPFGPGTPLALGGIELAGAPRLHGHSDGDVALHAVADALLGAAGLGDLGRIFPAGPATPRGIPSSLLLDDVVERLARVGLRPASLDLTIVAARPRLAPHLEAMRVAISERLGLPVGAVNVKASTGNLAGMEGAGRGVSAQAVAVVEAVA